MGADPPDAVTPGDLSEEDAAELRERFAKGGACVHCGGLHLRACPRVKRVVWARPGEPAEVEYWAEWPQEHIVWPEDVQ